MELAEIAAITGMPGLYKISARRNDGLIVNSLVDGKSQFVPARTHLFTTLDSITMYTTDEPVELKTVLASIKDNEKKHPVPDGKDDAKIKAWMEVVLPTYDKEKVYVSDMKKLAKWYTLLSDKNLIDELLVEKAEDASEEGGEEGKKAKPPVKDDKPKKDSKPKTGKADKSSKGTSKPAPAAKKITTPRKAS